MIGHEKLDKKGGGGLGLKPWRVRSAFHDKAFSYYYFFSVVGCTLVRFHKRSCFVMKKNKSIVGKNFAEESFGGYPA